MIPIVRCCEYSCLGQVGGENVSSRMLALGDAIELQATDTS